MSENTPADLADAIIQRLAHEVRYAQGPAESADIRTNPRDAYIYGGHLDGLERALIAAIQVADGERGTMDYYAEWAERYLAETPDAIGLTDLATRTPRKGGTWRDYRPAGQNA